MQGGLHATGIERRGGTGGTGQPAMAVGKEQDGVAMGGPEVTQEAVRGLRQGNESIPIALGVTDVHASTDGVDVTDLKPKSFAQTQAEAVEGEEEHAVTEHVGGSDDLLDFGHRNDVWQALALGRFDQAGGYPGLLQDMGVVELQAIQVEFDGGPGVRADEVGEVVGELRFGEGVDLVIEVRANAPDGPRIGVNGLGLQTFEFQVLQVRLVLLVK